MTEARRWLADFVRAPRFLARYPYYAAILARLEPIIDPGVRQMAVSLHDRRFYLHVNLEYFAVHPELLSGILLHEVHHIVLGHLTHPKFDGLADRDALQLAMEMSANEYVEEPLPEAIVWRTYASLGIRAGQSTMERYEKIVAHRGHELRSNWDDRASVDDHSPWRHAERTSGALQQTRQLIDDALDSAKRDPSARDPEGTPRHRLAGREPGRIVEQLVGIEGPPRTAVDWKTALQMFVVRSRAPRHTYGRPNRRFPDRVGEVPGRAYAPRIVARPAILVAVDTSMSMEPAELAEVVRQLAIMRVCARLTVVECDAEIGRVYPFDGAIGEFGGRGGTDLRPVFEPEFLAAHRPDGIVYFTDGEGEHPERAPRMPVLWMLTKGNAFACPWGSRATI